MSSKVLFPASCVGLDIVTGSYAAYLQSSATELPGHLLLSMLPQHVLHRHHVTSASVLHWFGFSWLKFFAVEDLT